jgi:hypothetical protein
MHDPRRSSRLPSHATTLLMLLAVGSVAAAAPPACDAPEGRVCLREGKAVRLAAAVVVAVARDLFGAGEHLGAALPALCPSPTRIAVGHALPPPATPAPAGAAALDERLLDLPPPRS